MLARRPDRCLALALAGVALLLSAPAAGAGEATVTLAQFKPRNPALEARLLAEFERRHPGVRVVVKELPAESDVQHQQYVTWLAARDPTVDVYLIDVIWPAEFAAAGWILPLDDRWPPAARADFLPGPLAAVTYQGRVYAVPRFTEAGVLYYRTDLVAKPPATWSELARLAREEARPGRAGYVFQGKQYEGLTVNVLELVWAHGGDLLRDGRVVIDEPAAARGLGVLVGLLESGAAPRGNTTYIEATSLHEFTEGRAVFHRNWAYAWAIANGPDSKVRGRFGVAPLPRERPDAPPVAALGGWNLAVSRFSRQPDLAWRLVEYLTSPEVQKAKALDEGRLPTRRALYDDPEILARHPHFAAVKGILEAARARPAHPAYPALSAILATHASRALVGQSRPEAALAAAAAEIRRLTGLR
ncbi:MAG TPA: ABC transporter substrate-binding protein [Thermodesulfobacteriota bacterium]|nr:ABC transporter substrate-binding protein [Thermodesulfobacteriota bacterium]